MRLGSKITAFIWGLMEATWFFIVPDVYLTLIALTSYRKALLACLWNVAGALCGGAIMYQFGRSNGLAATAFLDAIPAIAPSLIQKTESLLRENTLFGMIRGSITGIPYKIFAVEAGCLSITSFGLFLAYTIPARLLRFLLVASISAFVSQILLKTWSLRNKKRIHLGFWVLFYAEYFLLMG